MDGIERDGSPPWDGDKCMCRAGSLLEKEDLFKKRFAGNEIWEMGKSGNKDKVQNWLEFNAEEGPWRG
jgi:hypothetical protein